MGAIDPCDYGNKIVCVYINLSCVDIHLTFKAYIVMGRHLKSKEKSLV